MSTIKLLAQDGEMTEVELEVARISPTIRAMLDNLDEEGVLPLPNISTLILRKVMDWSAHHKDDYPLVEDDNGEPAADVWEDTWDTQFLQMDVSQLVDLLKVAHYLDIKVLINMGAKKMASMISGCRTPEEMRALLNIENNFSPEEEEQTRAESEWCMSSME